jgi:hypothetical protein
MTIQITQAEVTDIICAKYALPSGTEVQIIQNNSLPESVQTVIRSVEALNYNGNEKIAAIKAFRNNHPADRFPGAPGLAASKWAVENWPIFKTEVTRKGRLLTDAELDRFVQQLARNRSW